MTIRHTVTFRLKHEAGSVEERAFLADIRELGEIAGVQQFERLAQVSPKNDLHFGLSMEFADDAAYEAYNTHPVHVAFVNDRWIPEVAEFLEADFVQLP